MRYLIITEKPSAAKNFAKALGGQSGHYADFDYTITNLRGHVMQFKEPEEMVPADLTTAYKSWALKRLPWDLSQMNWSRTYIKGRNGTKALLDDLRRQARSGYDALIIATDTDPSGEGELLAWEAINAIRWSGQVLRANFLDESKRGIQAAMNHLRDVSDQWRDGDYVKGESRSRWDFASMQLTRIATTAAKKAGFKVVAREGRLKSVIVWKVYDQLEAIASYVKTPFFEVKFKDPAGHIYGRKLPEGDIVPWRYQNKTAGTGDLANFHESPVVNEKHEQKTQIPGRLLDLAGLAAVLAPKGFASEEVLTTYQKMYEAQIVSYPRTEDKNVTPGQFFELLPLIDQIAAVVGVDRRLLTHREPRFGSHVRNEGSHGANRPGSKIPATLGELSKYGKSGPAIYETLAKNYLATLAENYIYDHVTANLADYPEFVTMFNVPVALNYKAVYDTYATYQTDDEQESSPTSKEVGPTAQPYLAEGANKKPTHPSTKWIMAFLEKHNVGTGATRVSTLSEMTRPGSMMKEARGRLTLTDTGYVSAIMVADTWIASPKITKRLFDMMHAVGEFKMPMTELLDSVTKVVEHDMPIIVANADKLAPKLGTPKPVAAKPRKVVEKVTGVWQGQEVAFAKTWSDHTFTDEEIARLLRGEEISFASKSKRGKSYTATGKLAKQTFKGATFYGFKLNPKPRKSSK